MRASDYVNIVMAINLDIKLVYECVNISTVIFLDVKICSLYYCDVNIHICRYYDRVYYEYLHGQI